MSPAMNEAKEMNIHEAAPVAAALNEFAGISNVLITRYASRMRSIFRYIALPRFCFSLQAFEHLQHRLTIRYFPIPSSCRHPFHDLFADFDPFSSCRVGEASNPGPILRPDQLKLTFANPTAVNGKLAAFLDLNTDVLCLSETSATQTVQRQMTAAFRQHQYTSVWSPAVAAHPHAQRSEGALRGTASGTSIHSKIPIRPTRCTISDSIDSTRIVTAILSLGHFTIHIITIYGYPNPLPNAKSKTNDLLLEAARLVEAVNLPAIIVGDFNQKLHTLPAVRALQELHYTTTSQLYQHLYSTDMPMTCRNATCNDQMIFHPALISMVQSVCVQIDAPFADHAPVHIILKIPSRRQTTLKPKLPESWIPYTPPTHLIAQHFLELESHHPQLTNPSFSNSDSFPEALSQWARVCEEAVSQAIATAHRQNPEQYPDTKLPKTCQGRMKPPKQVSKPFTQPIKPACQGQFTPQLEVANFTILHLTKQMRRLQSFQARYLKLMAANATGRQWNQLNREWITIAQAKGFDQGFPTWCANIPEVGFFPFEQPDPAYLDTIIPFLKIEIDRSAMLQRQRQRSSKFRAMYDITHGHLKQAIRRTKPHATPPLAHVEQIHQCSAAIHVQDHGLVEFELPPNMHLRLDQPIKYAQQELQPVSQNDNILTAIHSDVDNPLPDRDVLTQMQFTVQPSEIADTLHDFWSQYWDAPLHHQPAWTDFQQYLDQAPCLPPIEVDLSDGQIWYQAAKTMKPHTARGVDGWYASELQTLPIECFTTLARIFHAFRDQPFPKQLCIAITLPLMKKPDQYTASNTRPITLLPVLYRLWSKVTTSQILAAWANTFPPSIIGFVKGRSPQNHMIGMQFELEQNHTKGSPLPKWQGLTLDLVKCFNLIPRLPAKKAMIAAGAPIHLVDVWLTTLNQTVRAWKIKDQLYLKHATTNGTPEGDTWSVLACLAISRLWAHKLAVGPTSPICYADNWSFKTTHLQNTLTAIADTVRFVASLELKIDWAKTWAWNTDNVARAEWTQQIKEHLPHDVQILFVSCALELGYTIQYQKRHTRATQKVRHEEALEQLKKVRQPHLTIQAKAKLCSYAITKALWGTESYVVGTTWHRGHRTAITAALLPDKKECQPLSCLHVDVPTFKGSRTLLYHAISQDM